jgi:hypothetical protein
VFICCDNPYSVGVPTLCIYNIQTLQKIKEIQYEPYRNKGMYPVKMQFENNAFIVMLSADTVDFTTLEIPIDDSENYRVIDSYSWENDPNFGKQN